jgi:hypothetical protein
VDTEALIYRRIYLTAIGKVGGMDEVAERLDIDLWHLHCFLEGLASPTDPVLLRTVDLIVPELSRISREFPDWHSHLITPRVRSKIPALTPAYRAESKI